MAPSNKITLKWILVTAPLLRKVMVAKATGPPLVSMKLLSLVYSPRLKLLRDLVIRYACAGTLHRSATRSVPKAAPVNAVIGTYKLHGKVLFQSNPTQEST